MYLIPRDRMIRKTLQGVELYLDISQVWKVARTPSCKPGEYALFMRDDDKNFTIFKGYVTYEDICEWFEMIKGTTQA